MIKINSLWMIHCNNEGVSHTFISLCRQQQGLDLKIRMVVPSCEPFCRQPNLVEAIPPSLKWFYYRLNDAPKRLTEKRFLKDMRDYDGAYLWPTTSLEIFRKVKKLDKPIILERINCYQGKAKRILDDAYKRVGLHPQHLITPERIQQEEAKAEIADLIFCPSPEVKKSFQEAGVPDQKLILTSYGWSPQRFPNIPSEKQPQEEVTVLFVGTLCIRKGVHLLLRAWERVGVKGRLMLCGQLYPEISEICGKSLARPDVVHVEYNKDIAFAYREADIFALPSLEEGGPQVTYEAMAHGLPILASPMAAGSIMRDGIDGAIVSPYDEDAWVEALRKLIHSPELRAQFGASARQRAEEFTWEKVAARRAALMLKQLNN
jgi:glycosyltransferase involved in cell wall biosynthesis